MRIKLSLILIIFTALLQFSTISAFAVTYGEKNEGYINQELSNGWDAPPEGSGREFKQPVSGSGKAKATDIPSWARNNPNGRPYTTENGKSFAERMMNEQYGSGNWKNNPNRMTEYSQLKKYGDRGFR